MSRTPSPLAAVFDAYGDDADAGLLALANTDPPFWSEYVDSAAAKQYRADYKRHRATVTLTVQRDALHEKAGQARLFQPEDTGTMVALRSVLVLDGEEYELRALAGEEGAAVLRKVAERDATPATTTLNRCRNLERLAEHIECESSRLNRSVSVAEVLEVAA